MQQRVCRHFNIAYHRKVLWHSTKQVLVENFITNVSALKEKPPDSVHIVHLPQGIQAVRQAFIRSPRKHSLPLVIQLHCEKNCTQGSKYPSVQIGDGARVTRSWHGKPYHGSWAFKWNFVSRNRLYDRWRKHTSIYLAVSSNRIITIGQGKIHSSPISGFFTVHIWLVWSDKLLSLSCFFKNKDGCADTVIFALYVEILWNFLTPELSQCGILFWALWFQQHDTTAHTATASMEVVCEMFLVCYFTAWRACMAYTFTWSLCLSVFTLEVYTTGPWAISYLKNIIWMQISVTENMARQALRELRALLEEYVHNEGQHLSKTKYIQA
jgi:hypothetical protein